ncbi:MAG: hypothetical protein AB7T63_16780 [Planctomycetota bacterium]
MGAASCLSESVHACIYDVAAEARPVVKKKASKGVESKAKYGWDRPPTAPAPADPDMARLSAQMPRAGARERMLAHVRGSLRVDTALQQAQDLMYRAWDAPPHRARTLAKQALGLSVDCADAYLVLAQGERHPGRALALCRQAVEAGQRALGPEAFARSLGCFWGVLETRPYMRARLALAELLWQLGEEREATAHLREMLVLNPHDNQGVRGVLLGWLLDTGAWDEAQALLTCYKDDLGADWSWSQALVVFQREGTCSAARRALAAAVKANAHVPIYLLGVRPLPRRLPEYMRFGDETEAWHYVADRKPAWQSVPGAIQWLEAMLGRGS